MSTSKRKPPTRATEPRHTQDPNHITDEAWLQELAKPIHDRLAAFYRSYGWPQDDLDDLKIEMQMKAIDMSQDVRRDYYATDNKLVNTIMNNVCRDYRRRKNRYESRYPLLRPSDNRHSTDHPAESIHSDIDMPRLMAAITPVQQILLTAHLGLDGSKPLQDFRRLAHIAGIRQSQVAVELENALATMREMLAPERAA